MDSLSIIKDLAIIVIVAKFFGLLARKCKAPQVVGEIIAGLVIGPCLLGWVQQSDFLTQMAEIGVILLMFSAGLETDLHELLKTGPVAFLIACAGVFIPLVGGTLLYMGFYGFSPLGSDEFYTALFMGVIMTATSVSITVQALRELGRLKGKVGTTILSAAIIDDVIGIVVLTFVIGFKSPDSNPGKVVLSTILFFVFAIVVGFISYHVFKWVDARYPHTRRIPIAGLAYCLALSYIAEKYFGIADITGAYVAGIILCSIHDSNYIAEKMDINSYMLFGPVFFASIGLKVSLPKMSSSVIYFSLLLILVAIITKIIGCSIGAKVFHYTKRECVQIGMGMISRGEVALIVADKGLAAGLIHGDLIGPVIIMVIVTTVLSPMFLKLSFKKPKAKKAA